MIIHIIAHNEVSTCGIELVYMTIRYVCAILSKKFPKPSVCCILKPIISTAIIVFLCSHPRSTIFHDRYDNIWSVWYLEINDFDFMVLYYTELFIISAIDVTCRVSIRFFYFLFYYFLKWNRCKLYQFRISF